MSIIDTGCPGAAAELAPEPVVVNSVTVDWANEKLVVRGSGFTVSTSFLLGSSVTPLVTSGVTDTELDIPFNLVMQAEVPSQGNYKLDVDGTVQLSIFFESQIIDAADTGCPCAADWATELGALLSFALVLCISVEAGAAEIDSVRVDRIGEKIIVTGSGFDFATTFTLGGVAVSTAGVTLTELDIPFSTDVASAVMWRGTYNLVVDGTTGFSVYIKAPIEDPAPPPPPPPPPPGGTTCPCTADWEASGIPKDQYSLCFYLLDGTQESTSITGCGITSVFDYCGKSLVT